MLVQKSDFLLEIMKKSVCMNADENTDAFIFSELSEERLRC